MAGSELRTYDIANRLSSSFRSRPDPHLVAARHRLRPNKFATEPSSTNRGEARLVRGPQAAAAEEHAARPGGGARGGGDVEYRRARPGRGLGFSFTTTRERWWPRWRKPGGQESGRSPCHDFWLALDPDRGAAGQRIAQTESSIIYGLGLQPHRAHQLQDGAVQERNIRDYGVRRLEDIPSCT